MTEAAPVSTEPGIWYRPTRSELTVGALSMTAGVLIGMVLARPLAIAVVDRFRGAGSAPPLALAVIGWAGPGVALLAVCGLTLFGRRDRRGWLTVLGMAVLLALGLGGAFGIAEPRADGTPLELIALGVDGAYWAGLGGSLLARCAGGSWRRGVWVLAGTQCAAPAMLAVAVTRL
jgi:hypothetical protein